MQKKKITELLKNAIANKNIDDLEKAIMAGFQTKENSDDYVGILIELLSADWHLCHENIVLQLQQLKDPRAIKILQKTVERKFKYLEYDDSFGLGRKCSWALADIGTEEAKEALRKIAASSNEKISGYAKKRLNRWHQEYKRKGR